jgi:hypothetical protein
MVLGVGSCSWTTPRGARRLVDRDLAFWLGAKKIRMVELDCRLHCESRTEHGAALAIVPFQVALDCHQTFLRYPDLSC